MTNSTATIRPAFTKWPEYNDRLRDVVARLSAQELAIEPAEDRWPLWATIGHLCCQRVFWLCDFAGQPGADTTPFTNAGFECPGDDYLEPALGPAELSGALESTFGIVENVLDGWTLEMLEEEISRPEWGADWVHTRGSVLQRVFSHDIWHAAELNESLVANGLPPIDLWD